MHKRNGVACYLAHVHVALHNWAGKLVSLKAGKLVKPILLGEMLHGPLQNRPNAAARHGITGHCHTGLV